MSLQEGRLASLSLEVSPKEKREFLDLASRLQLSYREALVHLLMLENEQRKLLDDSNRDRVIITSSTTSLGHNQDAVDSSQALEMQLTLTGSIWQRYTRIFQTRYQHWMILSHKEQFEMLLDLVEKNDGHSKTTSSQVLGTENFEKEPCTPETPKPNLFLHQTVTPLAPKKAVATDELIRERTPELGQRSISGLNDAIVSDLNSRFRIGMAESNDEVPSAWTTVDQLDNAALTIRLTDEPIDEKEFFEMNANQNEAPDALASKEPSGEVDSLPLSIRLRELNETQRPALPDLTDALLERYNKFFETRGFETRDNVEKLDLLLNLAESHQSFVSKGLEPGNQNKSRATRSKKKSEKIVKNKEPCKSKKKTQSKSETNSLKKQKVPVKQVGLAKKRQPVEEYDDDSDGSWNDGSKPKKKKIETETESRKPKNKILIIRLHPPMQERYTKFFEKIGWPNNPKADQMVLLIRLAESHPDLLGDTSATAPSLELDEIKAGARPEFPGAKMKQQLHVHLPWEWHEKYVNFFDQHHWGEINSEKKMEILLESAETHPVLFANENAVADRAVFDKSKFPFGKTEEEKTIDDNLKSDKAKDLPTALLEPDYYMKFSEEARSKRPPGSARTYAAMANTRRYIIEWLQLKRLIASCVCQHSKCQELINYKSIKIKEVSCVIVLKAHCHGVAQHPFTWASSAQVRHETNEQSNAYALNVAVASAIHFSGNNWAKMDYFAKVLRLSLGKHSYHDRTVQGCCLPVVRRCFKITQREMLEKLKEQKNGEIVLAGDGQFDSPGSCATLCTYTLMALGVDEKKDDHTTELKRFGYVISQAVIDRRHAESKSTNMERVGLHWALQPVIKAGVKVAELVTDEHGQIVSDFKKINAAAAERAANEKRKCDQHTALKTFKDLLSTALLHAQPPVDVEKNASELLSFYSGIIPSNDIWHKAKNLLKTVSTIARSAPTKEQACYSRYAKMLRNYLWECADRAKGNARTFIDLWTTVEKHLKGEHNDCSKVDLHSKTKLLHDLNQKTPSFAKLIVCINRVTASAQQLCRFRNTGILEAYNGLTLKYCPKRISFKYDVMTMRRELAALDHNHHVVRPYRTTRNGKLAVSQAFRKSTKAFRLMFAKEEKTYDYIGHIMAAVLLQRCQTDFNFRMGTANLSAAHPKRIQASLAPHQQSKEVTCQQYLSRTKATRHRLAAANTKTEKKPASKKRKAATSSSSSSESDSEAEEAKVSKKKPGSASDDDWVPEKETSKKSTLVKSRATKKRIISVSSAEGDQEPKGESTVSKRPRRELVERKKTKLMSSGSSASDSDESAENSDQDWD